MPDLLFYNELINPLLASLFPSLGYRLAADSPIVGFDFIDDNEGGGWILSEDIDHELSRSLDELFLLFRRDSVLGDLNVYQWHKFWFLKCYLPIQPPSTSMVVPCM